MVCVFLNFVSAEDIIANQDNCKALVLYHIESPPPQELALYHIESPPQQNLALYHIESPWL